MINMSLSINTTNLNIGDLINTSNTISYDKAAYSYSIPGYLKALHIMGKMLKYVKPMVNDEKLLNMIEEFEEEMSSYDFEEEEPKKKDEIEDLFVL